MPRYQGPAMGGLDKDSLIKRLEKRTVQINGCWIYNGGSKSKDGYTSIYIDRKAYKVHRLSAYIFHNLDLNSNLLACHKNECSSKMCWNPEHIYCGTNHQNTLDSVRANTHKETKRTHCIHGHELTESNTLKIQSVTSSFRKTFKRQCRECKKLRARKYRSLEYKNKDKNV